MNQHKQNFSKEEEDQLRDLVWKQCLKELAKIEYFPEKAEFRVWFKSGDLQTITASLPAELVMRLWIETREPKGSISLMKKLSEILEGKRKSE